MFIKMHFFIGFVSLYRPERDLSGYRSNGRLLTNPFELLMKYGPFFFGLSSFINRVSASTPYLASLVWWLMRR